MKRTVLIVLAMVILCVPTISCVKDEEDPQITTLKNEIVSLKNTITTINNELTTTKNTANEAKNNATAALNKANQVSTLDLSAYSTKATVPENLINNITEAQITTLKTKLGISGSGSSGSSGATPTTGQVTISIYKEPDMVYEEGSYTWYLEILNGYTEYKKVYVSMILSPVETSNYGDIITWDGNLTDPHGTYIYAPDLQTTGNTNGIFSMNYVPSVGVGLKSTDTTLISGSSQGSIVIKGNDKKVIPITLKLDYDGTGASRWEATFNNTALKYP